MNDRCSLGLNLSNAEKYRPLQRTDLTWRTKFMSDKLNLTCAKSKKISFLGFSAFLIVHTLHKPVVQREPMKYFETLITFGTCVHAYLQGLTPTNQMAHASKIPAENYLVLTPRIVPITVFLFFPSFYWVLNVVKTACSFAMSSSPECVAFKVRGTAKDCQNWTKVNCAHTIDPIAQFWNTVLSFRTQSKIVATYLHAVSCDCA